MSPDRNNNNTGDDDDDLAVWNAGPARHISAPPASTNTSETSSVVEEDQEEGNQEEKEKEEIEQQKDNNEYKRKTTKDRPNDHDVTGSSAPARLLLPSVDSLFRTTNPDFLRPVANTSFDLVPAAQQTHGDDDDDNINDVQAKNKTKKRKMRGKGDEPWDVSRMAPSLNNDARNDDEKTRTISAPAIRYNNAPNESVSMISMKNRGGQTKAMSVENFLEKGIGGAQLPRKRQDRKEKEKEKRSKGQSSHSQWKSEAEMALRQQYD